MADAKVKLVLLDACRDNPFAAKIRSMKSSTRAVTVQSGLAEMKSGEGTLIAFATSPGQVALDGEKGSNSPFTRALLNHIATPGVEIQQAMTRVRAQVNEETKKQQLPWGHTNLIGSVYLNASAAVAADANRPESAPIAAAGETQPQQEVAAVTPSTVVRSTAPSEVEIEFWRSIKDTNKPEELNAYLLNYPNGQFRPLALARLAALDAQQKAPGRKSNEVDPATMTAEATLATEDKLGLDRRKRTAIQKRLTALGFDTKPTGKFDDETREVIQRWQTARGYPSSGFFNKLQYQALMAEKVVEEREAAAPSGRYEHRSERRSRRSYSGGGGGGGGGMPNLGGGAGGAFIGGVIGGAFRRR
jgi:Caspase domain/Putative peptidoglycan binding domain